MNKYTGLSDFEINRLIARLNDGIRINDERTAIDCYIRSQSSPTSVRVCDGDIGYLTFDFCNNPADAMPIIIGNLISLMADMSEDRGSAWWCASDIKNGITSRYKSNPLRAAMEVFLMMKDAENENNNNS